MLGCLQIWTKLCRRPCKPLGSSPFPLLLLKALVTLKQCSGRGLLPLNIKSRLCKAKSKPELGKVGGGGGGGAGGVLWLCFVLESRLGIHNSLTHLTDGTLLPGMKCWHWRQLDSMTVMSLDQCLCSSTALVHD